MKTLKVIGAVIVIACGSLFLISRFSKSANADSENHTNATNSDRLVTVEARFKPHVSEK